MITVERVLFLRNVSLFSSMPSRELGRIAAVTTEVVYPAGSIVFSEHDYGDSMFLIVEGTVRIHRGETVLSILGEKAYFGEMSILDESPRSASATTETDCLFLCIKQADFYAILSSHFGATLSIVQTLTERIRRIEAASQHRPSESEDDPNSPTLTQRLRRIDVIGPNEPSGKKRVG